MPELQVFENTEFGSLSVITIDGKEYFQATEAARMLGYTNTNDAIIRHCRGVVKHDAPHPQSPEKTIEINFIPEGDLFRLITRSKLPAADRFEKWVFDEVLPTIRKHGAYMTEEVLMKSISDPKYIIGLLTALSETKKELNVKNQLIGELKPKADYLDLILKGKSLMTTSQISKDYGMSAQVFNKILHRLGIQFLQNDQWLLYSKYHAQGYTSSKMIPITRSDGRIEMKLNTQWTQKGRMFLYDMLKCDGCLPMIERN